MRWLTRIRPSASARVLESQRADVRVEGVDHLSSKQQVERVAILAHWAPDCRIDRSVIELTKALAESGYEVVVVSTVEGTDPLGWPEATPPLTTIRRPNVGYDFGSWATALDRYASIAPADKVLFVNNSLLGPFASIDHLIEHFEASSADVWGMTDSTQFGHHLQSYCLGFRGGALGEGSLARFWREIRVHRSREAVIEHGELGLGRLLRRERFVTDVAIPHWKVVAEGQNPVILGWRRLLDQGFPLVKRQLLKEPHVAPDAVLIPAELRRRFGVAVDEWS
jgi:lipopolysaccharide biosynthesis protein